MRKVQVFFILLIWLTCSCAAEAPGILTDSFLLRQRQALRPEHQQEIFELAAAPRYTIQAEVLPDDLLVRAEMDVIFTNSSQASIPNLVFRLPAFSRALYGGGEIIVTGASVLGKNASYSVDPSQNLLTITLPAAVEPGHVVTAHMEYETRIPASTSSGYGILSRARRVISLAGWYPILAVYRGGWQTPAFPEIGDAVYAETSLYELELRVTEGWQVVSTGEQEKLRNEDGRDVWQIISGPARELALAISPRFVVTTDETGPVRINYYSLPAQAEVSSAANGIGFAQEILASYQNRFGPYPWSELDLVDSSISIGGYEFPGMIYIEYSLRTREDREDFRWILAHEIAHQWWYGLVGSDQIRHPWLDEALATYSPAFYYFDNGGEEAESRLLRGYSSRANEAPHDQPSFLAGAGQFESWLPYNRVVYYQGARFLDELRAEMGETAFAELLFTYARDYRYRLATPEDFLALAEKLSGRDFEDLYRRWEINP